MEPIMCNQNVIMPDAGYIEGVRRICSETGTILIFDEVITGFRVAPGGAQSLLGVTPDLAVFGKAIANGLPVAAIAGRADLMDLMVTRRVMHGGTYNAHPLGMAATVATLTALADGSVHDRIAVRGRRLMEGFQTVLRNRQVAARVQGLPQIFHVTLGVRDPIHNYRDQVNADKAAYVRLTTALLGHGVRALERGAWFLSLAHDDAAIDATIEAFDRAVAEVLV
jgi:glutamate-1-semialdehyde 2,1-aminomutase